MPNLFLSRRYDSQLGGAFLQLVFPDNQNQGNLVSFAVLQLVEQSGIDLQKCERSNAAPLFTFHADLVGEFSFDVSSPELVAQLQPLCEHPLLCRGHEHFCRPLFDSIFLENDYFD